MRLTLGPRSYDLTTRALVMAVLHAPDDPVDFGTDIVEIADPGPPMPVPVCVVASDDAAVRKAVGVGVSLVRLPSPTRHDLGICAAGGVAVIIPSDVVDLAVAAGLPPDRIVTHDLLLDVTADHCPTAATAVGVVRGARIVRTRDVRGAHRIRDVLAAVMEAR